MKRIRTISDIIERFRTNWQGFLRRYWILITLTTLAAVADMFSTVYFMHVEGAAMERHPTIRLLSLFLGPMLGPVVGKLWQLIAMNARCLRKSWAKPIFIILYPPDHNNVVLNSL